MGGTDSQFEKAKGGKVNVNILCIKCQCLSVKVVPLSFSREMFTPV
jgi:hypothetical protein